MHPAFEIEARIRDYLNGKLAVGDLTEWFRANKGALFSMSPGSRPLELATLLELALIELRSGYADFNERQLKKALRTGLDTTFEFAVDNENLTSSSNETSTGDAGEFADPAFVILQLQLTPADK